MAKENKNMRDLGYIERWTAGSIESKLFEKTIGQGLYFVGMVDKNSENEIIHVCKEANLMYHSVISK